MCLGLRGSSHHVPRSGSIRSGGAMVAEWITEEQRARIAELVGEGATSWRLHDPNDALSTAIAALRHHSLRQVHADDHCAILRMLAARHHDLGALRTQAACRLHAALAALIPGGFSGRLSARRAASLLRSVRPTDGVTAERKAQASELVADLRRLDAAIAATRKRIEVA